MAFPVATRPTYLLRVHYEESIVLVSTSFYPPYTFPMAARSAFSLTLIECLFEAVLLELERNCDLNTENQGRLRDHLINLTAFQEVDQRSWGLHERASVKWVAAAAVWIAHVRKHCRAWIHLAECASHDLEVMEGRRRRLRFEELIENVASLRSRMEKAQEILEGLRTKVNEPPPGLGRTIMTSSEQLRTPLEDGEIRQDATTIHDVQWKHFKEMREYVSSLASDSKHEEQLHRFRELERQIISNTPTSSPLEIIPEEVHRVVTASMKDVRREADRVLVEIEDGLLRFKAREYARIWRCLEHVHEVISIYHRDALGPEMS